MTIRIELKGIPALRHRLREAGIGGGVERGVKLAGLIVEGDAKTRVHKVTRKLAQSLHTKISGSGLHTKAEIGPGPGLGSPRGYTKSQTSRWRKPRDGTNRGDPQDYAVFEEEGTRYREGHPFLEPALRNNETRIVRAIVAEIERALGGR